MSFLRRLAKVSVHSLYKQRQRARAVARAATMFREYAAAYPVRKLHVGAGGSPLEGWLNVDIEPLLPQIAYLDAAAPYPAATATFDYVHSEHVFEHLDLAQQRRMLAEVHRVLKPGGTIRTATPNFDVILALPSDRSAFADEYRRWSASAYYPEHVAALGEAASADVFVVNNYFHNWGHRFIHNPFSLRTLLERAGFSRVRQVAVGESADPVLASLEKHGTVIPDAYNRYETMVFEATR